MANKLKLIDQDEKRVQEIMFELGYSGLFYEPEDINEWHAHQIKSIPKDYHPEVWTLIWGTINNCSRRVAIRIAKQESNLDDFVKYMRVKYNMDLKDALAEFKEIK